MKKDDDEWRSTFENYFDLITQEKIKEQIVENVQLGFSENYILKKYNVPIEELKALIDESKNTK